jgi:ketosteroid isomerase-like protein
VSSAPINIQIATAILESAVSAWDSGNIEGVLDKYVDDIIFTTNSGRPEGGSVTLRGKADVRQRLQAAMNIVDCQSLLQSIRSDKDLIRTRVAVEIRHRQTGHTMSCTLRQILRFRGFLIAEQQDFYDAAKIGAFWSLIGTSRLSNPALP